MWGERFVNVDVPQQRVKPTILISEGEIINTYLSLLLTCSNECCVCKYCLYYDYHCCQMHFWRYLSEAEE